MTWHEDQAQYKARTGMACIPSLVTDPDSGWVLFASYGDLVWDGPGTGYMRDQLIVTAQDPTFGGSAAPVLDLAFNATTTFELLREGEEELLPDVAGLGPDVLISQPLFHLGDGLYATYQPGNSAISSIGGGRQYYDTVARGTAATGGFTVFEGSMVLGEWGMPSPFPADQPWVHNDWLLYESPNYTTPAIVKIGGYFLLDAQIRVDGLPQTYVGLPASGRVASTTFEIGDPRLISFLGAGGDYKEGARNLSAAATSRGFARW